jgi:hypothetical protein
MGGTKLVLATLILLAAASGCTVLEVRREIQIDNMPPTIVTMRIDVEVEQHHQK